MILDFGESTYVAQEILHELNGRGGFDGWWGEIDDEIQEEILVALSNVIQKAVDYCVAWA